MRDNASHLGLAPSIAPAVLTATATGSSVDLSGFNAATIVVQTGAIAGSGNFAPKVQESDDGTTWTDVAAADLIGTFPTALAASSIIKVGYKGYKRYVRPVLTLVSGTSIAAAASVIRGRAASRPVA